MVMSRQNMPVVVSARSRERPGTPDGAVSGDLAWDRAIRLFLEGWAADHPGIRPGTLGHYRDQLITRLAAFAQDRGIARVRDFSRHDLRAFVAWLDGLVTYAGSPLTPRGKQMALDAAKRFLLWLHQERLIPDDITAGVKKYRLDKDPEPRATPSADLEKILSSLDLGTPTGVRNTAMIHLMAFCGLRVSELVGLNANDLSMEEGRIRVRAETSKGRRTRFVDLPLTMCEGKKMVRPEVAGLMASWLRIRSETCPQLGEDDALFVTLGPNQWSRLTARGEEPDPHCRLAGERIKTDAVRVILKRVAVKAGADPRLVTPHRLRHYFGLTSAMAGVPTTALMRAMGHRSPIMTARYSEFADSQRRWAFARADITKGIRISGPST
jgi:site-specific recombinase XerD